MPRTPKIERKTEYFPIRGEVKAINDAQGIVEGYLNVKNCIDLGDDRTLDGCFRKTLADSYRRKTQQSLQGLWPYLFSHDYNTIPPGIVVDADEDRKGLFTRTQLFMDIPLARDIYAACKQGGLTSQSMGYKAHQFEYVKENGRSIRNLREVQICEASCVVFPMNTESVITSVKGGSSMFMRSKDFDSRYAAQTLDDWAYADWYDVSTALKQSIMDLFAPGGDPVADLETQVIPGLLTALRQYVSEGVDLGYISDSSNGMDMGMMSMVGGGFSEKSGYLNADAHTTIKTAVTNIMKHARQIQSASQSLEAQRSRALQGYPRAVASDRSIFQSKEEEDAERALFSSLATQLQVDNDLREIKEALHSDEMVSSATAGVDHALRQLLAKLA